MLSISIRIRTFLFASAINESTGFTALIVSLSYIHAWFDYIIISNSISYDILKILMEWTPFFQNRVQLCFYRGIVKWIIRLKLDFHEKQTIKRKRNGKPWYFASLDNHRDKINKPLLGIVPSLISFAELHWWEYGESNLINCYYRKSSQFSISNHESGTMIHSIIS